MVADWLIDGLVARGMAPHVAEAFAWNAKDESGLNPGINEAAPIVPGSRGGFGLMQWTGPRRRALEGFAAQKGIPVSDPDLQMDFLMYELQGPEAGAGKAIFGAGDSKTAAAAIVNKFLRPSEEHRARREAKYLGGVVDYQPTGNALAPAMRPSGGQQMPAAQNALAPPELQWADMRQDPRMFMNQRRGRNALASI